MERLILFYYVTEAQSFAGAAKKLEIDQSWLIRQVQQLEWQLGLRLFEKGLHRVELTAEGNELLDSAKKLAEKAKRTQSVARSLAPERRRELIIGVSSSTFWIPARKKLLDIAATRNPETLITTKVRNSTDLITDLHDREVDICIVGIGRDMSRFDFVTIHKSRPLLLVPKEHKLATIDTVLLEHIKGLDLAIPTIDNAYGFDAIYGPFLNGGAVPHWVPEGPLAAIYYALSHRIGMIAWGFEDTVNSSLVCREVSDCPAVIDVVAARNKDDERDATRKFWASVEVIAAQSAAMSSAN